MLTPQEIPQKVFRDYKIPFRIDDMLNRIEAAIRPFPKTLLFELYDRGYTKPFHILVACMVSIRTVDEVSLDVTLELFAKAKTPKALTKLSMEELLDVLQPSTFARQKAERLSLIAHEVENRYGGHLPCDLETLKSLPGVGPKTANLVMAITCGESMIGVDTHVHRVTNRWGYVQAKTPVETEDQLRDILPQQHWVRLNALLAPFGKHICTWDKPHCSTCSVLQYCRQVGVTEHR